MLSSFLYLKAPCNFWSPCSSGWNLTGWASHCRLFYGMNVRSIRRQDAPFRFTQSCFLARLGGVPDRWCFLVCPCVLLTSKNMTIIKRHPFSCLSFCGIKDFHECISRSFKDQVRRSSVRQPSGVSLVQPRRDRCWQNHERAPAFHGCVLAHVSRHRR